MIEVEARNLEEVGQILTTGQVHRILLDNFTPEQTRRAVEVIDGRVETESSEGSP
jgi:nicotinate-nucleotide pyrophosphorylase (carboxylating)